ncbi:hypothetical protein E4K10_49725 [Streptomyces sp. T1317-0309]|nr:hypothetical protein E4K10_49725 [Streptomyces sp. T1317-0309]
MQWTNESDAPYGADPYRGAGYAYGYGDEYGGSTVDTAPAASGPVEWAHAAQPAGYADTAGPNPYTAWPHLYVLTPDAPAAEPGPDTAGGTRATATCSPCRRPRTTTHRIFPRQDRTQRRTTRPGPSSSIPRGDASARAARRPPAGDSRRRLRGPADQHGAWRPHPQRPLRPATGLHPSAHTPGDHARHSRRRRPHRGKCDLRSTAGELPPHADAEDVRLRRPPGHLRGHPEPTTSTPAALESSSSAPTAAPIPTRTSKGRAIGSSHKPVK